MTDRTSEEKIKYLNMRINRQFQTMNRMEAQTYAEIWGYRLIIGALMNDRDRWKQATISWSSGETRLVDS